MSLTGGCAVQALWEGKRLDGRGLMDSRDIDITFGLDWGSCQVTLGRSRVLAQVSYPKQGLKKLISFHLEPFQKSSSFFFCNKFARYILEFGLPFYEKHALKHSLT
jgi:hypothetical protein